MGFLGFKTPKAGLSAAMLACLSLTAQTAFGQEPAIRAATPPAQRASDSLLPYSVLRGGPAPSTPRAEGEPLLVGEPTPAAAVAETTSPENIYASTFHDVEPGVTTVAEVKQAWGAPVSERDMEGQPVMSYATAPFRQVDLIIEGDVVGAIIIHLRANASPVHVAEQIGVAAFQPVAIPERDGRVLGQAYPERGVVLRFAEDPTQILVSHIVLEPVSAEGFVLRAEYDFNHRWRSNLRDLKTAIQLEPEFAHAYWLSAQLQADSGNESEALELVAEAVRLEPETVQYQLTQAELLGRAGQQTEAETLVRSVLKRNDLQGEIKALAHLALGQLLEEGTSAERAESLENYLAAINAAMPLATSQDFAVRRLAKRTLIESHLHAAEMVSRGNFENKNEAVARWLSGAEALLSDYVETDKGDALLWLDFQEAALTAAGGNNRQAVARLVERTGEIGRELSENATDELYRRGVHQAWGGALLAAVHAEDSQQNTAAALRHAQEAREHLTQGMEKVSPSAAQSRDLAELCFTTGALLVVEEQDHQGALSWYEQAADYLEACESSESQRFRHQIGGWCVTMGVTYWKTDQESKALELTRHGIDLMQEAVDNGDAAGSSLSVPCEIAAAMYRSQGETAKAEEFTRLAARALSPVEEGDTTLQR